MNRKILLNTVASGAVSERMVDGRRCLVTNCVSVELDAVMNKVFYPADVIREAYAQLDRLPAPASHPMVNGKLVPASDPVAMNAHNIGAYVMNPRLENKQVLNDLVIDIDVAERDERGVEVMRRLNNGERVGVSTGLDASILMVKGQKDGQPYDAVVNRINRYDHVAVLLDETPAGKNTFTVNAEGEDESVIIGNVNESMNAFRAALNDQAGEKFGGADSYAYVEDVLLSSKEAIIETANGLLRASYTLDAEGLPVLTGTGVAVKRVVTFDATNSAAPAAPHDEGGKMDKDKLILAIIANRNNSFTADDKDALESMSEIALVNALHGASEAPEVTTEQATAVLTNAGMAVESAELINEFKDSRELFNAFKAEQDEKRAALVNRITENSEMTADDVQGQTVEQLERLANSFNPTQNYGAQGGRAPRDPGAAVQCADFVN